MYPKAQNKLFADKSIKYKGKQKYGVAYYSSSPNYKNGFAYKAKSDSALINILFYNIDASLNYKGVIPPYEARYAYKAGAVFKVDGRVYVAKNNIEPQNIANAKLQQIDFLDKHIKYAPKAPYYSIRMLTNALENDTQGRKLLKKNKDNPYINLQYIDECMEYQFIDYTNQKNAVINNKDNYRIHLYNELFLTQKNASQTYAFQFNFLKKIIFINTSTKHFVEIKNNIFKHFPPGTFVKVCKSENDYIDNFVNVQQLADGFDNRIYVLHDKLEITQIDARKFVVEYAKGTELFFANESYLDVSKNKIIRFLINSRTISPLNEPREIIGKSDILTITDASAKSNITKIRNSIVPPLCLYLNTTSYILSFNKYGSASCLRYHSITSEIVNVKEIILPPNLKPIYSEKYIPRILKNYGQFPSDNHLIIWENHDTRFYYMLDISDPNNPIITSVLSKDFYYFQWSHYEKLDQKLYLISMDDTPTRVWYHAFERRNGENMHREVAIHAGVVFNVSIKVYDILSGKITKYQKTVEFTGIFSSYRRADTERRVAINYQLSSEGIFSVFGDKYKGLILRVSAPLIDVKMKLNLEDLSIKAVGSSIFFFSFKTSDSARVLLPAINNDYLMSYPFYSYYGGYNVKRKISPEITYKHGISYDAYVKPSSFIADSFNIPEKSITLRNFKLNRNEVNIYNSNINYQWDSSSQPLTLVCLWKDE